MVPCLPSAFQPQVTDTGWCQLPDEDSHSSFPQPRSSAAQLSMWRKYCRGVATSSTDHKFVSLQKQQLGELQPQSLSRDFRVADERTGRRNTPAQGEPTWSCFYFFPFPGSFSRLHPTVLLQGSFGNLVSSHDSLSSLIKVCPV